MRKGKSKKSVATIIRKIIILEENTNEEGRK